MVGASSQVDFVTNPSVNISGALLNMTVPSLTLISSGVTQFKGNIQAGSSASLSVTVIATTETEENIAVEATGFAHLKESAFFTDEFFYLNLNTTGWYTVTHTPPPYDPYGKNATIIPTLNVTSGGKSLAFSRDMATSTPVNFSPQSDPITVDGSLVFTKPGGGLFPARYVEIDVISEDSCICFDHRIGGPVLADNNGFFSLSVPNVGSWHISAFPQNINSVSILDRTGKVANGCPASNCDWGWWETIVDRRAGITPNSVIHLGTRGLAGDDPAFEIYDGMLTVSRTLAVNGFTQTWAQVSVYQSGGNYNAQTNIGLPPDGVIFFPNHANNVNPWGTATVYHEFGHALMERIYQLVNWPCSLGCTTVSPHTFESVAGPGFALSEGWAEFFSALIWGSPTGPGSSDGRGNIETNTWLCGGCNGDIVEGSVAATFWDLQDNTPGEHYATGGTDSISGSLHFFIGANAGDNNAEFHSSHRNDMLGIFTDMVNARVASLVALCQVFVGNGISPPQCQGIALSSTGSFSLLLIAAIAGLTVRIMRRNRGHHFIYPPHAE